MSGQPRQERLGLGWLFLLAILVLSAGCSGVTGSATPAPVPRGYLPLVVGVPGIANLLADGDFEQGSLQGWNIAGDVAISAAEHHSGSRSAAFGGAASADRLVDTTVGVAYKLTGWVKIVGETGADWGGFRFAAATSDWHPLAQTEWLLAAARGDQWFKVALSFTAATAQTRIQIGYFGGPARVMHVAVDDLALFQKGPNQPPTIVAALSPTSGTSLPQTQSFSVHADDRDGAIVRVAWDFGDGTRSFAASGTRLAALPGHYTATVRVADDDGAVAAQSIPWVAAGAGFPTLAIDTPAQASIVVHTATLAVGGSASGAANVSVSSDRGYAGAAGGASPWSAQVPLAPGNNRILVQATGANGRIVTAERMVRYVPPAPLRVVGPAAPSVPVTQWDVLELPFTIENSAATNPQFPYDPALPPGLTWLDGISVDGLFTPDNWQTVYRRPAFLRQPYQRGLKGNAEWLYPAGAPTWIVRFAPPTPGVWKYRIEAHEASGSVQSAEQSFAATPPASALNHGPLRVALYDARYFEYADGTPFLGTGHAISFGPDRFSYDAVDAFNQIGAGNQQFFRLWLGGNIWGSAWPAWRSRTLPNDGYLPATGLTVDRAYDDGLAALRLDAANPIMFQGWDTGHAGLLPGHAYRLRVRWRTENVTGPSTGGLPFGLTMKFVDWPEPGQTSTLPALIPHVSGDTPWHVAEANFTAQGDFLPNLALILENATGGAAYVDEVALYEVWPNGALGPQLLRGGRFNSQLAFDERRGAGLDAILAEANARGLAFKLVISEKDEYLLNHLAPDGLPEPNGGQFNSGDGSPTQRLHEYYWRYLFARFGAFRSVHSWELVNEAAPSPGDQFRLAADLARRAAADGNPHLASTSTWATLAVDAWKAPESSPIGYTDFHAYVRGTGWIEPKEQLAGDSAGFFSAYDQAAAQAGFGKPVIWGEQGIDSPGNTNVPDPLLADDRQGVWLHKLVWARCGPGGVYPLYWYTDQIFSQSLHPIFGAWNRFMSDIPFANGRYQDLAATATDPNLRVLGQRDLAAGRAYLWIDNRQHTWRAVVGGQNIAPVSGTVDLPLGQPKQAYTVAWFDTSTGAPATTETRTADANGVISLIVSNLKTDVAAKVTRTGGAP
jgi:hypothetical protein